MKTLKEILAERKRAKQTFADDNHDESETAMLTANAIWPHEADEWELAGLF